MEGGKKREYGIGLLEEVETGSLLRELVIYYWTIHLEEISCMIKPPR